jgi:hypothetical protein
MNSKYYEQFIQVSKFLTKYKEIHDVEFLKKYPSPYSDQISKWIYELRGWDFQKLANFETNPTPTEIKDNSFREFIQEIKNLTRLDSLNITETHLPTELLKKLKPKKKHEIQTLKTFFDNQIKYKTIIDIGGGAAHLSCALVHQSNKNSICVDFDEAIQASGKYKIKKWLAYLDDQVEFVTSKFDENTILKNSFDPRDTTIVGLHSCGDLSSSLLRFSIKEKIKSIVSFGCCYHKLNNSYNLSSIAKSHGINFTTNALHLANRSSAKVTKEDIERRFLVRKYRYTLHYYLYDHFNLHFSAIGNTSKEDYQSEFSNYARKYHKGNELDSVTDDELQIFFSCAETQEKVITNILADMIRLNLGRLIEVYLLLDRAIYLEESGRTAQLSECFDRILSPRNIMLTSEIIHE